MKSDTAKAEAYAQYYLGMFRDAVKVREAALETARRRLRIAECEYAAGKMVTGEKDGVPTILGGLLKQ